MRLKQEEFSAMVVAIGNFSPSQITPNWLLEKKLIGETDRELALSDKKLLISHALTQYSTDTFNVNVQANVLSVGTSEKFSDLVRDLAAGLLSSLASSEVSAIGVNFSAHYHISDYESYHRIGDKITPKAFWMDVFDIDEDKSNVGLSALHLQIAPISRQHMDPKTRLTQFRRIFIEASSRTSPGIYLLLNNHVEVPSIHDQYDRAEKVQTLINEIWDQGVVDAPTLFEKILNSAAA